LVVLAVAGPWYVWVGLRTNGEFLEGFFLTHNLHRATAAMEGHGGPIVYYVAALMIGFLPWSLLLIPSLIGAVRRIRRDDPWAPGLVFAACWLGVYIGIFSLAGTKLPSYITPAYPAAALLVGCYVYHLSRGTALSSRRWAGAGATAFAITGLGIMAGLPVAASFVLPGKEWLGVVGFIPLLGAGACWVLLRRNRMQAAVLSYAAAAAAFSLGVFAFAGPQVDESRVELQLLDTIAARSEQPEIFALGGLEPSWVFYARRPIPGIHIGDDRPDNHREALHDDSGNTYVLTTDERYEQLRDELPPDLVVLDRRPRFLREGEMLLLGRREPDIWLEAQRVGGRPTLR
jgi:4-amino-4-deoxy-L-arabinose transferase-like glycosyltransferase